MQPQLALLGCLAALVAGSPLAAPGPPPEANQKAQPDQYADLCQHPNNLNFQKFQDVGLGFTCRGIIAGIDKFSTSYQHMLQMHMANPGQVQCKAAEQNPCNGEGPQDLVNINNPSNCDPKNALSSAATLCMMQVINWSNYMSDLWMQTGNVWEDTKGRIPAMVQKFLPANQIHASVNKLTQQSFALGAIGGVIGPLVGAIPPLGPALGLAIGVATAMSSGIVGELGTLSLAQEREYDKAATLSDSMTLVGDTARSAITSFMDKVLNQPINPVGPDGKTYSPMEYADQTWSIPAMFYYGNWANTDDAHLPIQPTNAAGNNTFNFPALTKHANSVAINSLWSQGKVFVLKANKDSLHTASATPCNTPGQGPGFDSSGNKWCDDQGNVFIIMRWLTDDETPEIYDPRNAGSMDAPGVQNLGDYGLDYVDAIKTSYARQQRTGNFSSADDPNGFANTIANVNDVNNIDPSLYLGWNLPVCDLNGVPGSVEPSKKCHHELECYTRLQALCRCQNATAGAKPWPYPSYVEARDTICDPQHP